MIESNSERESSQIRPKHSRIGRNTVLLLISKLVGFGSIFVFNVAAPMILPEEQWGCLSTAMNYGALFLVSCDLGLSMLVVREVGRDHNLLRKYFSYGTTLKTAAGVLTFVLGVVVLQLLRDRYEVQTIRLIPWFLISTIVFSFSIFLGGLFRGIERMEYEALMTALEKPVILIVGLAWLYTGGGLRGTAFIFLGARLLTAVMGLFFIRSRINSIRPAFDRKELGALLHKAWPFAPFAVFANLYFQVDLFILGLIRGETEVGYYRVASHLVLVWLVIAESYSGALLPVLSRLFAERSPSLTAQCRRSIKWMTLVALPLALGISSLAKPIMASLYQERYPESWIVLAIVPWILLLRFLMEIPAVLLTAINRQLDRFYVVLTASIISIVLTLILVPRLGFKACAITTVVVNVYMLTALWYSAYRAGFKLVPDGKTLRIYVAGGVMFGALCFVSRFGLPLQVLTGAVVYVTAVVLLGVLDREEIRRLTTLLSRLK